MTDTALDQDLELDIDLESLLDDQDPDNVAHIVRRSGDLGAGALIVAAAEAGLAVTALCGRKFVPKGYAPDDLSPCSPCIAEWERISGQS